MKKEKKSISSDYSVIIARIGLALAFLWSSLNQLVNPHNFTKHIPSWIATESANNWLIVSFHGAFELIFAILLLVGLRTKLAVIMLALHEVFMLFTVHGSIETVSQLLSLVLLYYIYKHAPDSFCLELRKKYSKRKNDVGVNKSIKKKKTKRK